MRGLHISAITCLALASAAQAQAKPALAFADPLGGGPLTPMPGVLQCVPFARASSGIRLYGDAHTWWSQAAGKYARGRAPQPGAVMAIQPHGGSTLGHVATVTRVIDARTILISHANWSAPGKIERNVTAVDVSPANDWSEVRVWYAPIANLGGAHWPVSGFIYNARPGFAAKSRLMEKALLGSKPAKLAPTLTRFVPTKTVKVRFGNEPLPSATPVRMTRLRLAPRQPTQVRSTPVLIAKASPRRDPIGAIIASAR
jgi:hypothetical protein